MNKMEILKSLKEEEFENFLENEVKTVVYQELKNPSFSCGAYDIILNENGLTIVNFLSYSKNDAINIARIYCRDEFITIVTREILTDEQEEIILQFIKENELDYSEIESEESLEEIFNELFPDDYKKLEENIYSYMWEIQKNAIYDAFYELINDIEKRF